MKKTKTDKIVKTLKKEYSEKEEYIFATEDRVVISGSIPDILSLVARIIKTLIDKKDIPEHLIRTAVELPFKSQEEIFKIAREKLEELLKEIEESE